MANFHNRFVNIHPFFVMKASSVEYLEALRSWDRNLNRFGGLVVRELLAMQQLFYTTTLYITKSTHAQKIFSLVIKPQV